LLDRLTPHCKMAGYGDFSPVTPLCKDFVAHFLCAVSNKDDAKL
jgi:hypothetical protein